MTYPVFIALGSNLGDRLANLRAAVGGLFPRAPVCRISSVYETPPWGVLDQPYFLNMVVEAQTSLAPRELLDYLKALEVKIGREKTVLNGPRKIDLDILLYENQIYNDEQLAIPHPRLRGRGFALLPLAELAANLIHPVFRLRISGLLKECDTHNIRLFTGAKEFEESLGGKPILVPLDVALALKTNDQAARIFHDLPPSHQREHLSYILEARKAVTRQRRALKLVAILLDRGLAQ